MIQKFQKEVKRKHEISNSAKLLLDISPYPRERIAGVCKDLCGCLQQPFVTAEPGKSPGVGQQEQSKQRRACTVKVEFRSTQWLPGLTIILLIKRSQEQKHTLWPRQVLKQTKLAFDGRDQTHSRLGLGKPGGEGGGRLRSSRGDEGTPRLY